MLDLYEKGIEAYKAQHFEGAITNLKEALEIKDAKVEYWYYAEANAMLGVIYHFHKKTVGHLETARKYYKAALKIDPDTATAKKGLQQLGPSTAPKKKKE
jgi:tetratricopeptide (TPR) repeat protein